MEGAGVSGERKRTVKYKHLLGENKRMSTWDMALRTHRKEDKEEKR